jgi:hypothetical protein
MIDPTPALTYLDATQSTLEQIRATTARQSATRS